MQIPLITQARLWGHSVEGKRQYDVQFTGAYAPFFQELYMQFFQKELQATQALNGGKMPSFIEAYGCPCGPMLHILGCMGFEPVGHSAGADGNPSKDDFMLKYNPTHKPHAGIDDWFIFYESCVATNLLHNAQKYAKQFRLQKLQE